MIQAAIGDVTIIAIGFDPKEVFQLAAALSQATNDFTNLMPSFGCEATVETHNPENPIRKQPATSFTAYTDHGSAALQRRIEAAVRRSFPAKREFKITHDVPKEFKGHIPEARRINHNTTSTWVVCLTN